MATHAFYPAGFSPPSGMFSTMGTGARHSVWSPPGMGSGHQQPPPYGYSSAYPSFSYNSNSNSTAGYLPSATASQGFYAAPQHQQQQPQPRYSIPAPRPGITGQGQQPYAPVMAHRKPSLDLSSYASTSSHTPGATQVSYPHASAIPFSQLPLARCFSQPGSFAPQAVKYDPPNHPPPGFHHQQHHHHPHEPLPPYRAYEHSGRYFHPQESHSQQQHSQGVYSNLPPRLAGLQQQKQQLQQQQWAPTAPAPAPADNWNPWADTGYDVPAQRAPTKGVGGGANYGAVGEKRTKRVDVVGDDKDPMMFAAGGAAKEAGMSGGMDWEQLMNSVVFPEYDQASYGQSSHHTTPAPPPPPPAVESAPVEYQLVPPSNPVLPPPPIEKSAVPLSAVGASLMWKLCANPAFSIATDGLQTVNDDEYSWSPWNPEIAKPAVKPVVDAISPASKFTAFVESILTQTLLTPQVLLLAILYMSKVVARSWQLPLAEDSPLADPERAPYKMFLAGIMVANKILDDNSYRTETFAQVSGFALSELNTLEIFFLAALGWNLTVKRDEWRMWMGDVKNWNGRWHPSSPGKADAAATAMLVSLDEQAGSDEDPFHQRSPAEPTLHSFVAPATYASSSPDYYGVDLFQDAMGPVKSPFQMERVVAWQGTAGEA